MGTILSCEEEICNIRIIDAKSKPRKAVSVVARGDYVFTKINDNSVIVSKRLNKEKWAFPPSMTGWGFSWIPTTLKALVLLKMISPGVVKKHEEFCADKDAIRELGYSKDAFERLYKTHGKDVLKTWFDGLVVISKQD